jgi:hypothetical protein
MREDLHALRAGAGQDTGDVPDPGARDESAVEVVDIARGACGRRPGEENRHTVEARVLDELRHPQDRIAGRVVVAVNEQEEPSLPHGPLGEFTPDLCDEGRVGAVDDGIDDRELGPGIGGKAGGPLEFGDDVGRRNRDHDGGEAHVRRAAGREERAGHLGGFACRCDEDLVAGQVRHGVRGDLRVVDADEVRRARAARQESRHNRQDDWQRRHGCADDFHFNP